MGRWSLWLIVGLSACGGVREVDDGGGAPGGGAADGAGGSGGAGASSSGGAGAGAAPNEPVCPHEPPCEHEFYGCIVHQSGESRCRNIQCDLPEPCAGVEFSTEGSWGLEGPYQLETAETFACVMSALAAGTVGTYRWQVPSTRPFKGDGRFVVLHVLEGGLGLESEDRAGDLGTLRFTLGPAALKPATFFQDCADATGDAAFACLSEWSDGCTER